MTLPEILELITNGVVKSDFGDSIRNAYDEVPAGVGIVVNDTTSDDTLALFVVRELLDTYDEDASDEEQLETAERAMQMAMNDLDEVRAILVDAGRELLVRGS